MGAELRQYPTSCLSRFCGRTDCTGCPNLPKLEAFRAWRDTHGAERLDPVWAPTTWVAKVQPEEPERHERETYEVTPEGREELRRWRDEQAEEGARESQDRRRLIEPRPTWDISRKA